MQSQISNSRTKTKISSVLYIFCWITYQIIKELTKLLKPFDYILNALLSWLPSKPQSVEIIGNFLQLFMDESKSWNTEKNRGKSNVCFQVQSLFKFYYLVYTKRFSLWVYIFTLGPKCYVLISICHGFTTKKAIGTMDWSPTWRSILFLCTYIFKKYFFNFHTN